MDLATHSSYDEFESNIPFLSLSPHKAFEHSAATYQCNVTYNIANMLLYEAEGSRASTPRAFERTVWALVIHQLFVTRDENMASLEVTI
jgi:hypothetical protein